MNPKLAQFLVHLYSSSWRRRYGIEFVALLESDKSDLRTLANVGWSAICERILPTRGPTKGQSAHSIQFRSWCARVPWAIFGLGPAFLLSGAYFIALFMLWLGWKMFLPEAATPFGNPMSGLENIYFQAAKLLYFGAPVAIGWAVGVVAARQRAKAGWLSVGLVLIALAAASNQVHASRIEVPHGLGHISIGIGLGTSVSSIRPSLVRAFLYFAFAMLPYLVWRLQRSRSLFA